jgi:voltage-dependent potassium channel beta subunit
VEYRRLGKSGLRVSALSLGSWVTFKNQADVAAAKEMMAAAYDHGVNFFDNAEIYALGQSEVIMGQALKELGWRRDSYVVSSKVLWGSVPREERWPTQWGLNRKHVIEACHQAMERLQVDYLDLYFCHRPDSSTPIEETVRAMSDLIQQGKVLYWGTSEWSAQQIMEAYSVARQYHLVPPTMEQPHYNMFHRERVEVEYGRLYREIGLGTTTWSPLASGILTGKYNDGIPAGSRMDLEGYDWLVKRLESAEGQQQLAKVRQLTSIAKALDTNMARLALAWCLKNPDVSTVITGASRVSQVHDNMKALDVAEQLTDDIMAQIEEILQNKPEQPEF